MYIPKHFHCEDRDRLFSFMEAYSFATMVSQVEGQPFASLLPLLIDRDQNSILGHMAKANPHWESLDGASGVLCMFNGPHCYVSPSWYQDPSNNVPTWNYVAVHVYGEIELITEHDQLEDILRKTTEVFERSNGTEWSFETNQEKKSHLYNAIVGFRLKISSIEGKVKMSQNRKTEDAQALQKNLETLGECEVAALVKEFCKL